MSRYDHRAIGVVTTLIAVLCLAEAVLRFGLGFGHPILIAPDPDCGYIVKPDQHAFRFFSHTDINRYGMRSAEVPNLRIPHSLRVMFVGDSTTYGTSRIDQSRVFTELVHSELPAIVHEPVEVLNASASGWAIHNELSYVRSRGAFLSDIVVLVLNSEDLKQLPATFAKARDELPVKPEDTALGELFDRLLFSHTLPELEPANAGVDLRSSEAAEERRNLADLDTFVSLVEQHHERMALLYIPFPKDIHRDSEASAAVLRRWSSVNHVPLLDLTAVESQYSPKEITLGDGKHLNVRGHRIVATAIEESWPQLSPAAQ